MPATEDLSTRTRAGVRKPPRNETAGDGAPERAARAYDHQFGDCAAQASVPGAGEGRGSVLAPEDRRPEGPDGVRRRRTPRRARSEDCRVAARGRGRQGEA